MGHRNRIHDNFYFGRVNVDLFLKLDISKSAYKFLTYYQAQKADFYPSIGHLCNVLNMSSDTLTKAINSLIELNIITKTVRANKTNVIDLVYPTEWKVDFDVTEFMVKKPEPESKESRLEARIKELEDMIKNISQPTDVSFSKEDLGSL